MTATLTDETQTVDMTVDANQFGRAYLAVTEAAGTDDDRPALFRAVSLEFYDRQGVGLTATDGYMLLRAFVPSWPDEIVEPALDESPTAVAVALDTSNRAKVLMKYLVAATSGKDAPTMDLRLLVGPASIGLDTQTMSFDGMDKVCLLLEVPGQERLKLPTFEAEWVGWRDLFAGFREAKTGAVGLHADRIAQIGKASKDIGADLVEWHWGGAEKVARLNWPLSVPHLSGLVMPMRMFEPQAEETEGGEQ